MSIFWGRFFGFQHITTPLHTHPSPRTGRSVRPLLQKISCFSPAFTSKDSHVGPAHSRSPLHQTLTRKNELLYVWVLRNFQWRRLARPFTPLDANHWTKFDLFPLLILQLKTWEMSTHAPEEFAGFSGLVGSFQKLFEPATRAHEAAPHLAHITHLTRASPLTALRPHIMYVCM